MKPLSTRLRPPRYAEPVARLLSIGDPDVLDPDEWRDYEAEFGLSHADVPDLIRMACDEALHTARRKSREVWAPVHAWRALGQLGAEAAVAPLLEHVIVQAVDDDLVEIDLAQVFGMIGPAAIPYLRDFLVDRSRSEPVIATALSGLKEIALRHPRARGECVDILTGILAGGPDLEFLINGFAISALIDLKAVEAIDAIREAFRRDAVELAICGDLEDVEIELGLRGERVTPAPVHNLFGGAAPGSGSGDFESPGFEPPAFREKIGRNEPCPCGSGKKYKKCCLNSAAPG